MEKRELGVLGAVVLGIAIIWFFGNLTGYAVNETMVECNIADFNGDGIVSYVDKEDFGEAFSLSPVKEEMDERLDFNFDGIISIQDANVYNTLYEENYGAMTGSCYFREEELVETVETVEEITELPSEKPSFLQRIKDFFTGK